MSRSSVVHHRRNSRDRSSSRNLDNLMLKDVQQTESRSPDGRVITSSKHMLKSQPLASGSSSRIVTTSRKTFVDGRETSSSSDTGRMSSLTSSLDELLKMIEAKSSSSASFKPKITSFTSSSAGSGSSVRNVTRVHSVVTIINGKRTEKHSTSTSSIGGGSRAGSRTWSRSMYYGKVPNTTPDQRRQMTRIYTTSDLNGIFSSFPLSLFPVHLSYTHYWTEDWAGVVVKCLALKLTLDVQHSS